MRSLYCLPLVVLLAACEADNIVIAPTIVEWMEWPAEVTAATPFTVRVLIPWPYCGGGDPLNLGTSINQYAVTFAPYFLVKKHMPAPPIAGLCPYHSPYDTMGVVDLAASVARTFGMRAQSHVVSRNQVAVPFAVQTFGDVTVRVSNADTTRRNVAGFAGKGPDNLGCVHIGPSVGFAQGSSYVLDDQADTTRFWDTFVHGYIYEAASPVCGQTKVFHLVARY